MEETVGNKNRFFLLFYFYFLQFLRFGVKASCLSLVYAFVFYLYVKLLFLTKKVVFAATVFKWNCVIFLTQLFLCDFVDYFICCIFLNTQDKNCFACL